MHFRPAIFALLLGFSIVGGLACKKSVPAPAALSPTVPSPDTLASIHWVGKRHLDLEADAYYFSRVWSLPETARLQSQTLDHLATGVWRSLLGDQIGAQIPGAVLRPVLEELTLAESYLEIRAASNAPPSFVLATRVSSYYSGVWETNLAIAAELFTGSPAVPNPAGHGWALQRTNSPAQITFTRVGDWAVLSAGLPSSALPDDIAARIRRDGVPFVSAGTNLWLEADLNLPRLAEIFSISARQTGGEGRGEVGAFAPSSIIHHPSSLSRLNFSLSGDGANVITRATLTLAEPLARPLASWQLPLSLLHEPLTSFTAMRGLQPWLAGLPPLAKLPGGAPPDQLFLWSLSGSPYQLYLAAPLPDARQRVSTLCNDLMQNGNPWLTANGYISFDRAADGNGVTWGNLADIRPFIKAAGDDAQGWLYAGLFPDVPTNAIPPPAGMIQDILRRTNLVYYGWEVTGPRLQPCLQLGQTARLVARRPQMPADCASLVWLAALDPRLGTSATLVNQTGPAELTFYRRSTIGLTAPELQLLADWLESPQFPRALHSSIP